MPNMNIILNGATETIPEQITLTELIQNLDSPGPWKRITKTEPLIPRSRHDEHRLQEGDNVEVVQAIGGG